jgi:hypothetical protein
MRWGDDHKLQLDKDLKEYDLKPLQSTFSVVNFARIRRPMNKLKPRRNSNWPSPEQNSKSARPTVISVYGET